MGERFTGELDITENEIIREALELELNEYPRDDEVTTTQVAEMLNIDRYRAHSVLMGLVKKGLLTRRVARSNNTGHPHAYSPITTWEDVKQALLKEAGHGSKTVG
jgi:predicted transcriptional regulator